MSGVCPRCGVAVVPGYVKCPRCHAVLPGAGRFRRHLDASGTSLARRPFPILPAAVGAIAIGVTLFLVLGGGKQDGARSEPAGAGSPGEAASSVIESVPANAAPAPAPAPPPPEIPSATGPSPSSVAAELERALGRQRLWSSVAASGDRVDVRSGSCGDPAMGPMIDAARTALRGVGLTRLRCLAQSGAVVFERDL